MSEFDRISLSQYYSSEFSEEKRTNFLNELALSRWGRKFQSLPEKLKEVIIHGEAVKINVKAGRVTIKELNEVEDLLNKINSNHGNSTNQTVKEALREQLPEFYFQIMAVISEQFFRWHIVEKSKECTEEGEQIIAEIINRSDVKNRNHFLHSDSAVLKEQIRYCLAYIQSYSYHGGKQDGYTKTLSELEACQLFTLNRMAEDNSNWNGTLATIYSYLGRCYRNKFDYTQATKCFSQSLSFYEKKIDQPVEGFRATRFFKEIERNFVHHRMCLVLILGFAWMDIQHGRLYKALYNNLFPANALLENMDDDLAKNYRKLLEVAAMRWLSLPDYSRNDLEMKEKSIFSPQDSLRKCEKLITEIQKLGIIQFELHARYEYALCLDYCEKWDESESVADGMLQIIEKQMPEDSYWITRANVLKARILTRRFYHENRKMIGSEQKNGQPPKLFPLKQVEEYFRKTEIHRDKYIQPRSEYYLYYGEALMTAKKYDEALIQLNEALKLNRPVKRRYSSEPLNPKIEASCRLRICKIYIKTQRITEAREELRIWDETLSDLVDDIFLHYLADRNRVALDKDPRELRIRINSSEDLEFPTQLKELKKFLLNQAILEMKKDNLSWQEVSAKLGISRELLSQWREELGIAPPKKKTSN